jgi:tRNA A37 threonylcarbamoyladenosine dehydratase
MMDESSSAAVSAFRLDHHRPLKEGERRAMRNGRCSTSVMMRATDRHPMDDSSTSTSSARSTAMSTATTIRRLYLAEEKGPAVHTPGTWTAALQKVSLQGSTAPDIDPDVLFAGTGRLYSSATTPPTVVLQRLRQSTVIVVGLGGVGSWVAESITRSGVGRLVLVDLDDICLSNANRQVHATIHNIGRLKVQAMQERLHQINPHANIELVHDFITVDNIPSLLDEFVVVGDNVENMAIDDYDCGDDVTNNDTNNITNNITNTGYGTTTVPNIGTAPPAYVVDAIDGGREKAALIDYCRRHAVPIVTVGGAAGRTDPTKIVLQDLS